MFLPRADSTLFGMANTDTFGSEILKLDLLPIRYSQILDPRVGSGVRSSLEFSKYQSMALDKMVYELNTYILAEELVDKHVKRVACFTHNVVYPKTWWQHFKQDVLKKHRLTRWFVKWRPVVHKHEHKFDQATLEVNLKQYATFPAADLLWTPESIHYGVVVPKEKLSVYYREHL